MQKLLYSKGSTVKRHPTDWRKVFTNYLYNDGLVSRILQVHKKLKNNTTTHTVKKWVKDLDR